MPKRTYEVNAPSTVLGHEPGTTFEANLDPVQEARLLSSGALKTVHKSVTPPPAADLSKEKE